MTTDHYLDEWHHGDDPPAADDDESYDREYAEASAPEPPPLWPDDEARRPWRGGGR